ncbi:MAG TPA: M1 family metallopeptidase [Candidatus Obscuribacterales bacterium]
MSTETFAVKEETASYRLPRTFLPLKYDLEITPDLKGATFSGIETITVEAREPASAIVLNALDLEISSATVKGKDGKRLTGEVSFDRESERAEITFSSPLQPGTCELTLAFKGVLNDKLHGFYRSVYKDAKGKECIIAVTQFEPTDARRAFPCFDEPDFKATFKVRLIVDKGLTAISNAPVEKTTPLKDGKKIEVAFKETMKMSTYLVAFVVGELEATEAVNADGTPLQIWTPKGKTKLAKFAESVAAHSLRFFNRYYGIRYPGEKLDLIAVPDFMFGAMENLGAVIFRENALLVDEKTASHAELERVADVVAHELAHMWFGDLATMRWWNGLWLNEAFATFMEMLAVDDWKPEWRRWDTFGVSRAQAFATDGLLSTRPIEYTVTRPEDAEGMFDVLTYEKGASVLRMLEQYLGEETFRKGIARYLEKHKYANAETTDLWDAIEEESGQPVRQLMDSWIFQEGHPVVTVHPEEGCKHWTVSQQRFFYLPEEKRSQSRSGRHMRYQIPLLYRARIGKKVVRERLLLTSEKETISLEQAARPLILNDGGYGFYRVNYSPEALSAITAAIFEMLNPIERFNLVSDVWASTLNGNYSLLEFTKFASLFKEEQDKNVWVVLLGALTYLDRVVGKGNRTPLRNFASELLTPVFNRLGMDGKPGKRRNAKGEDKLTSQLRGLIVIAMGVIAENQEVRDRASELYLNYLSDKTSVNPDLAPAIITVLANCGDSSRYEEFTDHFRKAKTPQEEERYMYALAAFRDRKLLLKTLEKTINGEIRTQSAPYIVRAVMWNPFGRELAWNFMKDNWLKMLKIYPDGMIARMCEGITGLVSEDLLINAQEFFLANEVKQGRKLIAQHLEKLAVAVHFKERERYALERPWLKN